MGAWGPGTFENDQALDWVAHLANAGPDPVRAALDVVASAPRDADFDVGDACCALVAAELVAASCDGGCDRLGEDATAWVARCGGALGIPDRDVSLRVVQRIEGSSELQELWDEGGRDDAWHADVGELLRRLAR